MIKKEIEPLNRKFDSICALSTGNPASKSICSLCSNQSITIVKKQLRSMFGSQKHGEEKGPNVLYISMTFCVKWSDYNPVIS